MRYYLDPDYRKNPPKDKVYCVRCQKAIKDPAKAIKVTVIDDWFVTEGGTSLIGANCWKKIVNS